MAEALDPELPPISEKTKGYSGFYTQNTLPKGTSSQDQPPMPETIGPYKVESLLNKGGMSYLYLGLDPSTKTPVVLKVLSPRFLAHPELTGQFLKEARIIGMTDHPNIIKLLNQGEWEKGLYIAMEFVQGISLRQFIIQRALSLKSSLDIILQVTYALLHLHSHGVIHRDLKPENILITDKGGVKVIDFGIALLSFETEKGAVSPLGRLVGTPNYMSPQQKKDPLGVTTQTDIYSLGVILYELLIGKLSLGTMQLALIPQGLQPIVQKATHPSLKERYHDVVDLITELTDYIKDHGAKRGHLESDEVQELWERIELTHENLLPKTPEWDSFQIGIAHPHSTADLGLYYDFLRLRDNSYLVILMSSLSNHVESLSQIGKLQGMIKTLAQMEGARDKPFDLTAFTQSLNSLLALDEDSEPVTSGLLHLCPSEDQFTYISCGFDALWRMTPQTEEPHLLISKNPPLGADPSHTFLENSDNFTEGDCLVLHAFNTSPTKKVEIENLENHIPTLAMDVFELTPQKQAEALLKSMYDLSSIGTTKSSQAVITIQRIS